MRYFDLATALDTLCPQAFGSGHNLLVGIHTQRMFYLLLIATLPISVVWFTSPWILCKIIPDQRIALLSGQYLRVLIAGAPGYAMFECGRRFTQAQGIFDATLWVLLICSGLNIFLNWLLVWVSKKLSNCRRRLLPISHRRS